MLRSLGVATGFGAEAEGAVLVPEFERVHSSEMSEIAVRLCGHRAGKVQERTAITIEGVGGTFS